MFANQNYLFLVLSTLPVISKSFKVPPGLEEVDQTGAVDNHHDERFSAQRIWGPEGRLYLSLPFCRLSAAPCKVHIASLNIQLLTRRSLRRPTSFSIQNFQIFYHDIFKDCHVFIFQYDSFLPLTSHTIAPQKVSRTEGTDMLVLSGSESYGNSYGNLVLCHPSSC